MIEYLISFLVLIGIFVFSYVSTRFLGTRLTYGTSSKYMTVVDRLILDKETRVSVVNIQGTYYLLGHSPSQVTNLGELADFMEKPADEVTTSPFTTMFTQFLKERNTHERKD